MVTPLGAAVGARVSRWVSTRPMLRDRLAGVFALAAVVAIALSFGFLVDSVNYDVWSAIVTFVVLVVVTAPILKWLSTIDRDPREFNILVAALVVKLLMSLARYYMINVVYGGSADAATYHSGGVFMSAHIKAGYSNIDLGPFLEGFPSESRRMGALTGFIYLVTGPSQFSGFFVFSWFSYLGNLMIYRGVRRGFSEGNHRRFLYLVMFLPSMTFWPSSIGKEAWMMLNLGMMAYGAGVLLSRKPSAIGVVPLAVGFGGAMLVRPHMAMILVLALAVGLGFLLLGGQSGVAVKSGRFRGTGTRLVMLGLLVVFVLAAASRIGGLVGRADSGSDSASGGNDVEAVLEETLQRSSQGGSSFDTSPVRSPEQVPGAVLSVLLRPYPWEARSANALISALEGLFVAGLIVASWRSLKQLPGLIWRTPFLVFVAVYSLAFVIAFSNIGNAGILARQRVQVFPFIMTMLAVPTVARDGSRKSSGGQSTDGVASPVPEPMLAADQLGAAAVVDHAFGRAKS